MSEQRSRTAEGTHSAAHITDAAARAGLGSHRRTYGPTRHDWLRIHRFGYVATVLLVLALVGLFTHMPTLAVLAGFLLIPSVAGWVIVILRAIRLTRGVERLDLYDAGLAAVFDGQLRVVRYDTTTVLQDIVRHIRNGAHTHTTYAYTLTDVADEKFVLPGGFANPTEWGPAIQDAVTEVQLPRAYDELRAGRRLDFGTLWISATDIGAPTKSVPWSNVELITTDRGTVTILVGGKWLALTSTPVRDIPNFLIFHALADHLRRVYAPQQRSASAPRQW